MGFDRKSVVTSLEAANGSKLYYFSITLFIEAKNVLQPSSYLHVCVRRVRLGARNSTGWDFDMKQLHFDLGLIKALKSKF